MVAALVGLLDEADVVVLGVVVAVVGFGGALKPTLGFYARTTTTAQKMSEITREMRLTRWAVPAGETHRWWG